MSPQSSEGSTLLRPLTHRSASIRYSNEELSGASYPSEEFRSKPSSSVSASSTVQMPHIFQSDAPDLSLPLKAQTKHDEYTIVGTPTEAESNQPLSQRRLSRWNSFFQGATDRWMFEVLACAGSLAALIGIIIVLIIHNGRSLPNWPYGITINSVLSWFATAMKAMMLVAIAACISQAKWTYFHSKTHALADMVIYDSASRGPQGSVQLLWKFQARHIACLGALITVLAIGIDPFVQQVASVETRNATSNDPATLGRAQSFLQYAYTVFGFDVPLAFDMLGSMYSGTFINSTDSNGLSFGMNPSCPTGNCTFPLFQSLAVCHHCAIITDVLETTCQVTETRLVGAILSCQQSLPNGLKLNTTNASGGSHPLALVATSGYLGPVGTREFGHTLVNFTRIIRQSTVPGVSADARNVTAGECVLYWCVNTYEANVVNGALNERVVESWHSNSTEWQQDADRLNSIWVDLKPSAINNQSSASRFPVAYLATKSLSDWLAAKLSVSNSEFIDFPKEGSMSYGPALTANQSRDSRDTIMSLSRPDINEVFSNLAASMTRSVREVDWNTQTYGDGWLEPVKGVGTANGTAWTLEVYIHVRWPWLILPISLVALTILFLILTVVETARSKVMVWKSSPVPLLFHGLENAEAERLRLATQLVEMERMAEKVPVRLEETDTGWRLVK